MIQITRSFKDVPFPPAPPWTYGFPNGRADYSGLTSLEDSVVRVRTPKST